MHNAAQQFILRFLPENLLPQSSGRSTETDKHDSMVSKGRFIYIVDDDPSVTRALCRLLDSAGFRAQAFASAEQLLEFGNPKETECLILDIRLPGMNGIELQKKLNASGSKFPVIFITAYDDVQAEEEAIHSGAIAFLRKPFEDQLLLDAVRTSISQNNQQNDRKTS